MNKIYAMLARHREQAKGKKFYWLKRFFLFGLFLAFLGFLAVIAFLLVVIKDLPNISQINEILFSQSSTIYDRNGVQLYTIHGDENRKIVPLDDVPDEVIFATLSIEDSEFFEHHGFSVKGIMRAVFSELLHFGAHKSGGSTLTQQFVKNTFLTSEKTYTRKLKELILSLQLEWKFSKEDILAMYLNSIPYGSNAFGVEKASHVFFGKDVNDISLNEAAILASLPKAPTYYSPYGEHAHTTFTMTQDELLALDVSSYNELLTEIGESSIILGLLPKELTFENGSTIIAPGRTSLVLNRMEELGFIDNKQREQAEVDLANFVFKKYREEIKAPHFVLYVRDLLEQKYGKEVLYGGGLEIYTTLDYSLQEQAQTIVEEQAVINQERYRASNAAVMSVDPRTGEILTMVGSQDYWDEEIDGNVNVMLQRRLPGSSFKPFAYASAFSSGYAPGSVVFDVETNFGSKQNEYIPQNFDEKFRGPTTLRSALGNSLNIPAIKAGVLGGLQKTYDIARGMGLNFLKDAEHYGGALPLGVAEIRPMDMAQAYATFANMGVRKDLTPILKIVDRNGNILEALEETKGQQVLDEETAYLVTDVLADPNARGPGWNSMLQLPGRVNASKTGTSNKRNKEDEIEPFDGWTIGYTPSLVTVAWAGNNDGSTMNKRASGFVVAGPIWRKLMMAALEGTKDEPFEKPAGIKEALVSRLSGKLPSDSFPPELVVKEVFSSKNLPKEYDNSLQFIEVEKISGDLPNEYTPESSKENVAVVVWSSQRPWDDLWEDPVQEWAERYSEEYFRPYNIDNVLAKAPTEVETIHTKRNTSNPPEVKITAPVAFGNVSKSGVGVWVDIASDYGVGLVEYYLDSKLVDTVNVPPYKGNIKFPEETDIGDSFTITVKAYDTLYNSGTSTVNVKVGEDNQAPITEIVYPKNGDEFPGSSTISVQTNSYDTRSDIDRVEFYLNGEKVSSVRSAPYQSFVELPRTTGKQTIRVVAFDSSANTSEDTIEVETTAKEISRAMKVESPSEVHSTDSVAVQMHVPVEDVAGLTSIELIARYVSVSGETKDTTLITIDNIHQDSGGLFHYLWIRPERGEYLLFEKLKYDNGKTLFSAKNKVIVK